MLFNPNWTPAETKPDVFSLESLVAWLETMPAAKRYDYYNCNGKCLYGQYMAAHGFSWLEACSFEWRTETYRIACRAPYTFGAALIRARQALADQQARDVASSSRESV